MTEPTRCAPSAASARASDMFRLSRDAGGGFRVETEGGDPVVLAEPHEEGFLVSSASAGRLGVMREDASFPGGFVIEGPGGNEDALVGRTSREGGRAGLPASLLARDGRLFRVLTRVAAGESRFELVGQETPGAYLTARGAGAYAIERTIAGTDLDLAPEILILFAAEILKAEF